MPRWSPADRAPATAPSDFRGEDGGVVRARFEEQALGRARSGRAQKERRRRIRSLLARDGGNCWLCGNPLGGDVTFDHVVPRSKGGSNKLTNLRLAHADCNSRRGAPSP